MRADRHMNTETTHPPPPGVGIVDDDRELRTALRLLLESAGHVVETWADADACLAAMHPQRSGCLLLDLRLPGISGLELLAVLRQRHIAMPFILITAYGGPEIHLEALRQGADACIDKPFDLPNGVKLMFPRDPSGPVAETINCGCTSLPFMDSWEVAQPGRRPFSDDEIAASVAAS